jgi:hypothetical protein
MDCRWGHPIIGEEPMKTPSFLVILALARVVVPAESAAQVSAQVTVKFPVNLTQFGPDLAKIKVSCDIFSDAITNGISTGNHIIRKEQELPVSGGQVTADVSLVYSITGLNNPAGTLASVTCILLGWSTSAQIWLSFSPTETNSSFKTTSVIPNNNGSTFYWDKP